MIVFGGQEREVRITPRNSGREESSNLHGIVYGGQVEISPCRCGVHAVGRVCRGRETKDKEVPLVQIAQTTKRGERVRRKG